MLDHGNKMETGKGQSLKGIIDFMLYEGERGKGKGEWRRYDTFSPTLFNVRMWKRGERESERGLRTQEMTQVST